MFQCSMFGEVDYPTYQRHRRVLIWVSIIGVLFLISQIIGGVLSHSLAVLLDAAHVFSDILGFWVSLYALRVSIYPPTASLSYGYHRAEIVGALGSIGCIWVVTIILLIEAIERIVTPVAVNGQLMCIMGIVGFVQAAVIAGMLHYSGHGHSHGPDLGHSHSHGGHGHSHAGHGHSHGHSHGGHILLKSEALEPDAIHSLEVEAPQITNLNMHAAFLHALGDMIQSVGVIIAGALIWHWPHLTLVDPLCTFLFALIVLKSTVPILRGLIHTIMQASPPQLDLDALKTDLLSIEEVEQLEHVHVWTLSPGKIAFTAHIGTTAYCAQYAEVIEQVTTVLKRYDIQHPTLQLEPHVEPEDGLR